MMTTPSRLLLPLLRSLLLGSALVLLSGSIAFGQAPSNLRARLMGSGSRAVLKLDLNGETFGGYAVFSKTPYVLWQWDRSAPAPFARDIEAARKWLARAGKALGHADFEPYFVEIQSWRRDEVWSFGLKRKGLELYDARVMVEWGDGKLVGIVNQVDLPLIHIEEPTDDDANKGRQVYFAQRSKHGYRAMLENVHVLRSKELTLTRVGSQTTVTAATPPATGIEPQPFAEWKEWNVPQGGYPDQIAVHASGMIWFSQPIDHALTRFDPRLQTFQQYPTTGGLSPDGMCIDSAGILWTGLYDSLALGRLDPATGIHTTFTMPYSGGNPAIPMTTSLGTLWVTDHVGNRVSEFDLATQSWLSSHVLPGPTSWVVASSEDPSDKTVYFTAYSTNKLVYKPFGLPLQSTNTPSGGPAFSVVSDSKVYYSLWSAAKLGKYDPATGLHTTYAFPVASERGGPIGVMRDGRIVIGTRNAGYIFVFDPTTQRFQSYKIPGSNPGLKDGLTVEPDGTIWFTETGANRIARLRIR